MRKKYDNKIMARRRLPAALLLGFMLSFLLAFPGLTAAQSDSDCQQAVSLIKAQKKQMGRDLRQIKRELAQIKNDMEEPGVSEILGGIGYIIGMFGISYYWLAVNKSKKQ